jgi:hypothetical protein
MKPAAAPILIDDLDAPGVRRFLRAVRALVEERPAKAPPQPLDAQIEDAA